MPRAPVYRNINLQSSYFGIEVGDAGVLVLIGAILFLLNPEGKAMDLLAVVVLYVSIRVGKRGKAPGYTLDLLRYSISRRVFLSAGEPDASGRKQQFGEKL